MQKPRRNCSIWDLDPREGEEHTFAEYQQLFMDAYQHRFGLRATPRRVRPYLGRYLRFGVIAPWVCSYLRQQRRSHPLARLAEAPLDPVLDWRQLLRTLYRLGWELYRLHAGGRGDGGLRA